jgi:hypothetical protein
MAEVSSLPAMTIVLVHGGFVDGSGWESVYKILKKDGGGRRSARTSAPHNEDGS